MPQRSNPRSKPERQLRFQDEYTEGIDSAQIVIESPEPQKGRIELKWSASPNINVTIMVLGGLVALGVTARELPTNWPLLGSVVALVLAGIAAQLRLAHHEQRRSNGEDPA